MDPFSSLGATQGQAKDALSNKKKAKVMFDYPGQEGNYISLRKGSVIDVIHVGAKGGWTKGIELGTGKSVTLKIYIILQEI